MGLEESGKMVGEDSAAKAARQMEAAGEAGTRESGRSRVAVLVLLALSFAWVKEEEGQAHFLAENAGGAVQAHAYGTPESRVLQ